MDLARLPYALRRRLQVYTDIYLRRRKPIIVYTLGRVGSMALYYSLTERGICAIHLHTLRQDRIHGWHPNGVVRPVAYNAIVRPVAYNAVVRRVAYNAVVRLGYPADIITIMRDPMARMVSDFFPKLHLIAGRDGAVTLPTDELCTLFNTTYFDQGRHLYVLNWPDDEMKTILGVNLYAHEAPTTQQAACFEHRQCRVLVLRTDMADDVKSRFVSNFLGLSDLVIERRNVGDEKWYGDSYQLFKKQLIVSPPHLDTVYGSQYAQHFFSSAEIEAFRAYWGRKR